MSQVKWIKLTTGMFEDEKVDFIESLPEADAILVIWVKLLTQAGKCNSNGFIFLTEEIPYTEEMLAHKFRRPLSVVRLALSTFKNLGMINIDEAGYLKLANWEKHQNIEGLDKIREQTRERVAKHREKQKLLSEGNVICNVTVTEGNATEEIRIDKNRIEEEKDKNREEDNNPAAPYEELKELFNNTCKSLSQIRSLSNKRKKHLKARWKQFDCNIDVFVEVFNKVENSDFCKGDNSRGWKVDFDWLIQNDNNIVKVLEGKYDNTIGGKDGAKSSENNSSSRRGSSKESDEFFKKAKERGWLDIKEEDLECDF